MNVSFERVSEITITEKEFLTTIDYAGREADIDESEDLGPQVEYLMKNHKEEVAKVMADFCRSMSMPEKVFTFDPATRSITILSQKMIVDWGK